jgi:hypothetical protein
VKKRGSSKAGLGKGEGEGEAGRARGAMGVRAGLSARTWVAPTLSTYGDVAGKLGAYPQALTGSAAPPTGNAVGPLSPDAVTTVDPAH